jgi:perosamine synthetase
VILLCKCALFFGKEEKDAICKYMDEDGFMTEFKRTERFEQMIADYTGAKHCIVVNNGTISLTLASMAAGIKQGDEVIVPNYTMIATPNSIKNVWSYSSLCRRRTYNIMFRY